MSAQLPRKLQQALDSLSSSKIKERTAALDETRNLIGPTASSAILDRVARSGWVELLQAISNLIIVERNAYDASAPNKRAPSEKRMLDGAGLLKSIVERTCACFPRKAVKVLFKHCFTIIIFQQDQVFRPITLDTLRTLNAALSVRQHLEHLEDAQWLDLVRLASGVALGTPVRLDSKNGMDDELYLSQSDSEDEGRHRPKSKGKVKEPSEGPHAQDLIESFTLLAHLMHSPNANLILLPQASALLQRFSRLFQLVMPVHQNLIVETTSHLPLLQAFNGLLSQLVDNASMPLTKHAPLIWLQLTRLWSGIKTAAVKEQTLISFKRLTPVILSLPDDAMRQQCCRALFGNLSDEPSSRFRIEELALDALQLRPSRPLNPASSLFPDIFELPTFCWAPTQSFGPGQAASWSLLDSTSDCLFVLFQMSEKAGATQTRTSTDSPGPSKRRKLEDPISDLLVGLAHLQDARQRVHQLQILLFLVSKNWNNLHSELNRKVLQSLQNLLTEDDLDSRSWAFCCLAAAAAAQASSHEAPVQASTSKTALLQKETDSSWEFIWSSALRNLTNRNVCRAAAHAVSALLQPHLEQSMPSKPSPHPLVPLHIVRSSTFSLIQDLAVQGPGFPSDSVCETLTAFLRIARADAELFQASFPTKILAWLTSVWKPDARRSRCVKGEWEDPVSLIRLMLHLIGVDDIARKVPRLEVVPPRCDIVQVAIDDATCVRVRHFLYETQIDDSSSPNDTNSSQSKLPTISGAGELSISTAVLTFCQEALEAYLPEDDTQPSSQSHNFESLQRALKLLSVSLFVFGAVRSKRPQSQRTLTRHASRLLRHLIPSVVSSRWNSSEKASLVAILGIFLCPATASPFQNVLRGLTHPGPVSNVPMHLYHSPEAPCLDACMSDIISQIWSSDDLAPLLSEGGPINTVCRHMALNTSLSFVEGADVEPYNDGTPKSSLITQKGLSQFTTQIASSQIKLDQDSDDGFGSVRDAAPAGIKRKTGGGPRHGANPASSNSVLSAQDHCTEVITLTALKGLLAPLHANVATTPAVGLSAQPIISLLAESEGESFLAILNALLSLISSGLVCLSLSEADQLFEKIGTSFLPAYEHARDPRTYLLTVRLLSVSAALWVPASEEDQSGAFTSNARKLCTWLSDVQSQARLAAWRVRLELVAFLDHFTQLNPQENIWGDEDLAEDDNGAHLVPTQLVPQMIQDVDFRVRFQASSSSARVMEAMEAQGVEIGSYFQRLMLAVPANIDEPELLLTRILCCGNLMIVVSYVRRLAYESLLDISLATPRYNDYLLATLKGIHVRLGVSSVSQLFETFLLYYSWRKTTTAEPNFLQQLPAKVCGYVSAGQRAQSVFMQLGGFFQSLEDKENFTALRKAASYSSSTDAFLDCFAEYAAQNLLSTADGCIQAGEDPSASLETSLGRINEIFSTNVTASIPFDSFFVSSSDRILASVFSRMHSMTFDATSPIAQILAERWAGANPQLAPFYQRLVSGAPPFCLYAQGQEYDVYTCLQVCSLILKSLPSPDYHLPVAYNIVQHLVSDIATASFLDDKRRLLGVLAVALVVFRQSAQDPAVIRIVLHGCAHLYRQADLASQCYPIFCTMMQVHQTYVESFTSRTAEIIKTLPSVLVEMSRTAQSHHQNSSYSHLADIFAGHLFHLREDILASLGSSSDERLQRQARLAQMLWPASPKDLLFSVSELEHALRSPSDLGSNIFELVHPLSKAADSDTSIPSSRLSTSLWIVLSLTNQDSEIKPVAASALARLVKRCQGRITPPPLTKDNLKGSSFYGRLPIYQEASNVDLFRRILVDLTAGLLLSSDLTLNEAASRTLRAVFDLAPRGTFEASTSLEDSARDLVCLASPLLRRPPRNLPKDKPRHGLEDLRKWMRPNVATSPEWTSGVSEVLLSLLSAHDPFFSKFNHLICLSKSFARDVFPVLVYCLLSLRHEESGEVSMLEDLFNAILLQDFSPLDAVGSVVDAMLYLRHFEQGQPPQSSLSGDRWLGISWKAVAHGAMRSHGAPTALLCMELAHEQTLGGGAPQPSSSALLQLEYEIFENLDEPDGFYSVNTQDVTQSLLRRYRHEGRSEEAYRLSGAIFEAKQQVFSGHGDISLAAHSMAAFGFDRQALALLGTAPNVERRGLPYDLAWKAGKWDLPLPAGGELRDGPTAIYTVLRSLQQDRDFQHSQSLLDNALVHQATRLFNISDSSPVPDKVATSALLTLFTVQQLQPSHSSPLAPNDLSGLPFDITKELLAAQLCLLTGARQQEEAVQWTNVASDNFLRLLKAEQDCHLQLSRRARTANHLDLAYKATAAASLLINKLDDFSQDEIVNVCQSNLSEEQAFVLWQRGDHSDALKVLNSLQSTMEQGTLGVGGVEDELAILQSRLGVWTHEARIQSESDILANFFHPAVERLSNSSLVPQRRAEVHLQFSKFADAQLSLLLSRQDEMRRLADAQIRRQQQISDLRGRAGASQDRQRRSQLEVAAHESSRVALDEQEMLRAFQQTKDRYRRLSMQQTATVLTLTDEHDDLVYRLISLWFSIASPESLDQVHRDESDKLHKEFRQLLKNITSSKFVFLAPQLTARLSKQAQKDSVHFRKGLSSLVERLSRDHPYHLLYLLYNLRYSSSAKSASNKKSKRSSSTLGSDSVAQAARVKAAEDVINSLKANTQFKDRLELVDMACEAYHEWANYDPTSEGEKKRRPEGYLPLPRSLSIAKLQSVPLPVSTYHLPVEPSGRYETSTLPTIVRYHEQFKIAGGINRPKISDCIGSDGRRYKQLFKGGDDTRQDAVMEQVFSLVNILLEQDSDTRRRNLRMRTYQIIPLRAKTGLMEFVTDSRSIQEVLTGLLGKLRPKDLDFPRCRKLLVNARKENSPDKNPSSTSPNVAGMKKALLEIYSRNQPVMRFKFFEAHKQPSKWFEMRLNYTRSVAVTSIVGYILGIGDRHISNLLLDTVRGELVPIDFGYAFDGGTRLAIPETVPFRLTRNIIDGFGSSGVEGVYRRSCEEVYRVLRLRESVVMTVLDVFKYDPLQRWDVSIEKVQRDQGGVPAKGGLERTGALSSISEDDSTEAEGEDDDVPALAEQALRGVSQKIKSDGLSVEYKVNELIQQASDPARLSMLFAGWQPYA